jgi:hypothetical protein
MNFAPLPLVERNSGIIIEDMLPDVLAGRASLENILQFCKMYRRIGICRLFLSGIPDEFFANLFKSARAYLFYLERGKEEEKITSKSAPFFDAVACNDFEGARQIALKSRPRWNQEEEYEDDFLYFYFLMKYFFLDKTPDHDLLSQILERYEKVLEGNEDVRLDLCKSLLEKDSDSFNAALETFVSQEEDAYQQLLTTESVDPQDAVTVKRISIEGLALARLAEELQMKTQRNYLLIPSLARKFNRAKLPPPNAWTKIVSYYQFR